MIRTLTWLAVALAVLCVVWVAIAVRRYAARRRLEEERAAAFVADAIESKRDRAQGTDQKPG